MHGALNMKVLHGLTGAAGQPFILSRGLRKLGIDADAVLIGPNRFGYVTDIALDNSPTPFLAASAFLRRRGLDYDIFHMHFRPYFYTSPANLDFPTFADLICLKAAGKRIVYHFRGSEIRLHSVFKEKSPYNYVDENPNNLVGTFPEATMMRTRAMAEAVADRVLVSDYELLTYVPNATIVPRAIHLDDFPAIGPVNTNVPTIVHAPSREQVKGSAHVEAAIERLRRKGLKFDYRKVKDMSHEEAVAAYRGADIIVDQLRIGWYGVLSVEGMALGKAVVCYIREDLKQHLPAPLPLMPATPEDIEARLEELIRDPAKRAAIGAAGRNWVENHHADDVVAGRLAAIYRDVMNEYRPADLDGLLEFVEYQAERQRTLAELREGTDIFSLHNIRMVRQHLRDSGLKQTMRMAGEKIRRRFGRGRQ